MKKTILKSIKVFSGLLIMCMLLTAGSCDVSTETQNSRQDTKNTLQVGDKLAKNQPTPTDIDYTVERYLLQKRAYWLNGQREKARMLPCPIADMPIGYIILFAGSLPVESFIVDGKAVSLNSYLSPDSEYYEGMNTDVNGERGVTSSIYVNKWLPDVDGAYGYNDGGIFFFTIDGGYFEWGGEGRSYLYSDRPMKIDNPMIQIGEKGDE